MPRACEGRELQRWQRPVGIGAQGRHRAVRNERVSLLAAAMNEDDRHSKDMPDTHHRGHYPPSLRKLCSHHPTHTRLARGGHDRTLPVPSPPGWSPASGPKSSPPFTPVKWKRAVWGRRVGGWAGGWLAVYACVGGLAWGEAGAGAALPTRVAPSIAHILAHAPREPARAAPNPWVAM